MSQFTIARIRRSASEPIVATRRGMCPTQAFHPTRRVARERPLRRASIARAFTLKRVGRSRFLRAATPHEWRTPRGRRSPLGTFQLVAQSLRNRSARRGGQMPHVCTSHADLGPCIRWFSCPCARSVLSKATASHTEVVLLRLRAVRSSGSSAFRYAMERHIFTVREHARRTVAAGRHRFGAPHAATSVRPA